MSYIESVPYLSVPSRGEQQSKKLRVYALSTCAFCERAMDFLRDQGLGYEYLFVDQLDPDVKRALKLELKENYGNIPVFPLLVIDGKTPVSGYTEAKWKEVLEIA